MPTIRQLSHAAALIEEGSFSAAATACNISQSAFSRSIQSLEETLGATLFDRFSSHVEPTVFGVSVLAKAASIGFELEELEREIASLKGLTTGSLSVAMGSNAAEISGNKALGALSSELPGVEFQVRVVGWQEVIDAVLGREAELGFAEISTIADDQQFEVESVASHPGIFICRRQHPLRARKRLKVADLDPYRVVIMPGLKAIQRFMPEIGDVIEGVNESKKPIVVDNYSSACEIVRHSDAVTMATKEQFDSWPNSADFHILPISYPWLYLDYGFISLRSRSLSPAAARFMEVVRGIESEIGS